MEDDFCLTIKYFWTSWVPDTILDAMKDLTLKIKALKVQVKDWVQKCSAKMNC